MSSLEFGDVEHFTVGAIGEPGRRLFLLQISAAGSLITLKVEKGQVAGLAAYLGEALSELSRPGHIPEDLDLRQPLEVSWTVGAISVDHDADNDRLVVRVDEADLPLIEDGPEATNDLTFTVTREQAAAVAIQGTALLGAGRPPCPLCGYPIEAGGHACPRTNGNRPPDL